MMKKRFCLLGAMLLSILLTHPALSESMAYKLDAVTYTPQWVYYDGYVAEISVLEKANHPDTALVEALLYDPDHLEQEPASIALQEAPSVIGSYCEAEFFDGAGDPTRLLASGGGSNTPAGRELDSYAFISLPFGFSPGSLRAEVFVGVCANAVNHYEQQGSFTVPMPRQDSPLVASNGELELGSLRVRQLTVSRTPSMLVVNIYHLPLPGDGLSAYSVRTTDSAILQYRSFDSDDQTAKDLVHVQYTFSLPIDEPVPNELWLFHNSAPAEGLRMDLRSGAVQAVQKSTP